MKNRATIIVVCFLLALAQGQVVNWAGNWDLKTTESDDACYPEKTVLITQSVGTITASWIWGSTKPCVDAKINGKQFTQTVNNPEADKLNVLALKITVGTVVIDGTFTVNGDGAVFASNNGASSTYERRQQMVNWLGIWDIATQDLAACNPDGSITISQLNNGLLVSWTWANSQPCIDAALAGKTFSVPASTPTGNAVAVNIEFPTATVAGIFAIIHDQAVFASASGASATFVRRQELVNWVGTWDVKSQQSTSACYPDEFVTIIPSGGNLIASWIWANSDACNLVGLSGKPFTQTQPVPKGKAIFLDFFVGGAYVSGLFTATADDAVFASYTGGSATFTRRSQMVNWAGAWEIATTDNTACYPDGTITVGQTKDNITISWTWAKTTPCSILALASKKFSATVDTPKANSVTLDVSSENTTISALLTLFLDGAVFASTNGASSTYMRKQESVNFAGTWNIQNQTSTTSCYPNTSIVITQAKGNVTAKWTWANSAPCDAVGLSGKDFTQTQPVPRGRAIFLDIIVGTARVSGLFTVDGNQGTFASNNGASSSFLRTSDDAPGSSWTGVIIAIVIILVIAVAGYLYIQHRNKKLQGDSVMGNSSGVYNKA